MSVSTVKTTRGQHEFTLTFVPLCVRVRVRASASVCVCVAEEVKDSDSGKNHRMIF